MRESIDRQIHDAVVADFGWPPLRTAFRLAGARRLLALTLIVIATLSGCASRRPTGHILFLDGASHLGSASSVKRGLRDAGYDGSFEGFVWTSFMLWGVDHLVAAHSERNTQRLVERIEKIRRSDPAGYVAVMGLSAGCAVVVLALEDLPNDVLVDDVVLFQPSVAADHNLSRALAHVKGRMLVTSSRSDTILAGMTLNADGNVGRPAGRVGFRIPRALSASNRERYRKLVRIPWKRTYGRLGWGGGHVTATHSRFVREVIAPYIVSAQRDVLRKKETLYSPPDMPDHPDDDTDEIADPDVSETVSSQPQPVSSSQPKAAK